MSQLDPQSLRFQQEVDALVRRWAADDEREYWRRWKQLGSWSINKTQGDVVKKGQVLCVVEAMKLMNEIESEVDGRIVKILAESTKPVEFGQPLFLIDPAPAP